MQKELFTCVHIIVYNCRYNTAPNLQTIIMAQMLLEGRVTANYQHISNVLFFYAI